MIRLFKRPEALLVLLGFLAYGPTLRVGFLYDDHILIESNPALRSWSPSVLKNDLSTGMFRHPRGQGTDFFRPLQTWSTRLEYSLFGLHPFPYHLTNWLFQVGNALLLYILL